MRFISLVYKNLTRRPARTLLTISGLATAVAAVVSLMGIAQGFQKSFADIYESHGVDLVVSRKGAADKLSGAMDGSTPAKLLQVEGVTQAGALLIDAMSLEEDEVYGLPVMGIPPDSFMMDDYRISDGTKITSSDERVTLLGSQLAERIGKRVGDDVVFFEEEKFKVVGIYESYSTWENGSMIIPLSQLQRLSDRDNQITFVNVKLASQTTDAVEKTRQAIEAIDPTFSAMPTRDFVKNDARIQIAGAMANMTSLIALFIGAIGMLNTMITSVYDRTRELGILRAIGWKRYRVIGMILSEACLLSAVAALIGATFGVICTRLLSQLPAVSGVISPHISFAALLQGFAIAIVIGLLGAAYPAYRAACLLPTAAFRHD
ncbi:MAG: ABC transporter permease [Planctomycetales bacterium]|nr:ABC transporter permease [Planctomycetales bacterium]